MMATDDAARATVASVSISETENVQVNTCIAASSLCTTGPIMTVSSDTHCVQPCKKANDECVSSCESSKKHTDWEFSQFPALETMATHYSTWKILCSGCSYLVFGSILNCFSVINFPAIV